MPEKTASQVKRWSFRIGLSIVFIIGILIGTIFNPGLLYAYHTDLAGHSIYHNQPLEKETALRLKNAQVLLQKSTLYDSSFKLDICLNDGSFYPRILEFLQGNAFGYGFSNKAVLNGKLSFEKNCSEINGYKWNLTELIAHEATHCYQAHSYGFWNSNPIAQYPNWKWEGYAEYIARQNQRDDSLSFAKKKWKTTSPELWEVKMDDTTTCGREYYQARMLIQFCLENKGMTYDEILESDLSKESLFEELLKSQE